MDIKSTFDNEAGIYEQTSRQVNIHYDEALSTMISFLPNGIKNVLDICCGTGILTQKVADKYKKANILGVDFSNGMLDIAKQRFNKKNVNFYTCDLLDSDTLTKIQQKFDLVVSSFGVHNVHGSENKVVALQNVAKLMNKGAMYITCDLLKGNNKKEQKEYYEVQKNHLLKSFNAKETEEWLSLLDEEDDPETWDMNVEILTKAGFKDVKLLWKKDFLAIWTAVKE